MPCEGNIDIYLPDLEGFLRLDIHLGHKLLMPISPSQPWLAV